MLRFDDGVGARRLLQITFAITFMMLVALTSGVVAHAQSGQVKDTAVGAYLCGTEGSLISITSPKNDTKISATSVEIKGVVSQATQIEVRVNDAYDRTIPLNFQQSAFSTVLTLTYGGHTIKVIANDACGNSNGEDEIKIKTVAPAGAPSNTNNTSNPDSGGGPGQTITGEEVDKDGVSGNPGTLTPFEKLLAPVARELDLDTALQDGMTKGLTRISLVVVGAVLLSLPLFASAGINFSWPISKIMHTNIHMRGFGRVGSVITLGTIGLSLIAAGLLI